MIVLGPDSPIPVDLRWQAVRALLPESASAAFAEAYDTPDPFFPGEEAGVARAVEARRREFALGRSCARRALAELGVAGSSIPIDRDRAPRWPPGIVGSITHCAGLVAAVVAKQSALQGIGVDAEPATPLGRDLVHLVCTPSEMEWAAAAQPPDAADWPKVLFSAKEAIHKCIAPMSGVMLDFRDVDVTINAPLRTFSAALRAPATERLPDFLAIVGRFAVTEQYVLTVAFIASAGADRRPGLQAAP